MDPSVRWDDEQKSPTLFPATGYRLPATGYRTNTNPYACSIVQSSGCWLIRAYSLTWDTLDSATSRV